MWWHAMALCSDFLINMGKIQTARERHYVIAETWPLYFWNQYNDGFQMSYHKDLAYASSIFVKLRGSPKNAKLHPKKPIKVQKIELTRWQIHWSQKNIVIMFWSTDITVFSKPESTMLYFPITSWTTENVISEICDLNLVKPGDFFNDFGMAKVSSGWHRHHLFPRPSVPK